MIDIETLDTKDTAVILSLGIVQFAKQGIIRQLYIPCTIDDQLKLGRTISEDTIKFWLKQETTAQQVFFGEKKSLSAMLQMLYKFIKTIPATGICIWANGPDFDLAILNNAYNQLNITEPWKYNTGRCFRTFCQLTGKKLEKMIGTKHNALDDAEHQAKHMITNWNISLEEGELK